MSDLRQLINEIFSFGRAKNEYLIVHKMCNLPNVNFDFGGQMKWRIQWFFFWYIIIFKIYSIKSILTFDRQSIPYSPVNSEPKALNNSGCSETRSGRESYDLLKCCDNMKTTGESNSPLNRCMVRYRDEEYIDCQFSTCGCNFRTTDLNQLNVHNDENVHRHMNVRIGN